MCIFLDDVLIKLGFKRPQNILNFCVKSGHRMRRIPYTPLLLGLAGLLPFIWGAATIISPQLRDWGTDHLAAGFVAAKVLNIYGTVILSFMSGILWGFAAKASGFRATLGYILSVMPALGIFFLLAVSQENFGIYLLIGFSALLVLDYLFSKLDLVPNWWMSLRLILTCVVVSCLVLGILAS